MLQARNSLCKVPEEVRERPGVEGGEGDATPGGLELFEGGFEFYPQQEAPGVVSRGGQDPVHVSRISLVVLGRRDGVRHSSREGRRNSPGTPYPAQEKAPCSSCGGDLAPGLSAPTPTARAICLPCLCVCLSQGGFSRFAFFGHSILWGEGRRGSYSHCRSCR